MYGPKQSKPDYDDDELSELTRVQLQLEDRDRTRLLEAPADVNRRPPPVSSRTPTRRQTRPPTSRGMETLRSPVSSRPPSRAASEASYAHSSTSDPRIPSGFNHVSPVSPVHHDRSRYGSRPRTSTVGDERPPTSTSPLGENHQRREHRDVPAASTLRSRHGQQSSPQPSVHVHSRPRRSRRATVQTEDEAEEYDTRPRRPSQHRDLSAARSFASVTTAVDQEPPQSGPWDIYYGYVLLAGGTPAEQASAFAMIRARFQEVGVSAIPTEELNAMRLSLQISEARLQRSEEERDRLEDSYSDSRDRTRELEDRSHTAGQMLYNTQGELAWALDEIRDLNARLRPYENYERSQQLDEWAQGGVMPYHPHLAQIRDSHAPTASSSQSRRSNPPTTPRRDRQSRDSPRR